MFDSGCNLLNPNGPRIDNKTIETEEIKTRDGLPEDLTVVLICIAGNLFAFVVVMVVILCCRASQRPSSELSKDKVVIKISPVVVNSVLDEDDLEMSSSAMPLKPKTFLVSDILGEGEDHLTEEKAKDQEANYFEKKSVVDDADGTDGTDGNGEIRARGH